MMGKVTSMMAKKEEMMFEEVHNTNSECVYVLFGLTSWAFGPQLASLTSATTLRGFIGLMVLMPCLQCMPCHIL